MNLANLNTINEWFKAKKNSLIKKNLKIIPVSAIICVFDCFLIFTNHPNSTSTTISLIFLSIILSISLTTLIYNIVSLIKVKRNYYENSQLDINVEEKTFYSQENIDNIINFLLSISLTAKSVSEFPLSYIQKIENFLIYNKTLLENYQLDNITKTIQEKISAHNYFISQAMFKALTYFNQSKLSKSSEFKSLLENKDKAHKIKLLQTFEKKEFEKQQLDKQNEKELSILELNQAREIEQKLAQKISEIENQYNAVNTKKTKSLAL